MPNTTQLVLDFAVERFIDTIQNLCDDPSWLEHEEHGLQAIDRLRDIAMALQLDFDAVVRQYGSDFEVERLQQIEARLRGAR